VFWVFGSSSVVPGGDNVMLTVATSDAFNAPARLLFPKADFTGTDGDSFPYSLLGLGDVVVPGLLAALALRYDASRCVDLRPRASAALAAIENALSELPTDADRRSMGQAAADAAIEAYDKVAQADDAQRLASTSGGGLSDRAAPLVPATDAVMQQRRYFKAVMIAYVVGLLAAFYANAVTSVGQPALLYLSPATLGAVAWTATLRDEVQRVLSFVDIAKSSFRPGSKS
jgi:minor histocompatibility antigen H13